MRHQKITNEAGRSSVLVWLLIAAACFFVLWRIDPQIEPLPSSPARRDGTDASAMVTFYRDWAFNAGGLGAAIGIDGKEVAVLPCKSYVELPLQQGKHVVSVRANADLNYEFLEITLKVGDRLLYEVRPNPSRPIIRISGGKAFVLVKKEEHSAGNARAYDGYRRVQISLK